MKNNEFLEEILTISIGQLLKHLMAEVILFRQSGCPWIIISKDKHEGYSIRGFFELYMTK